MALDAAPLWLPPKPAVIRQSNLRKTASGLVIFGARAPSIVYTGAAKNTSNAGSYSFTMGLGTASDRRHIVVLFSSFSGFGFTLSSASVAGISVTVLQSNGTTGLLIAHVPASSGTSGTVTLNFSGTMSACLAEAYALYDLRSATPFHSVSASGTGSPLSMNLNLAARGIAVGCGGSGVGAMSWSGATEDHEDSADGQFLSAAHYVATAAETGRSLQVSGSGFKYTTAASFR